MIFLAVVDLPRAVPDTCEACEGPAAALLFTISRPHWVDRKGSARDFYGGGPDVFVLCRHCAKEARAIMDASLFDVPGLGAAHAHRRGGVTASWGKVRLARAAKETP